MTTAAESFGIAVPVATSAARLHVLVVSENAQAFLPYFQLLRLVLELLPAVIFFCSSISFFTFNSSFLQSKLFLNFTLQVEHSF